jgi:hypothetical protein
MPYAAPPTQLPVVTEDDTSLFRVVIDHWTLSQKLEWISVLERRLSILKDACKLV